MIVIGAHSHKRTHTVVALEAVGRRLAEEWWVDERLPLQRRDGDRKVRGAVRGRPAFLGARSQGRCGCGDMMISGVSRGTGGRSVFPGRFVLKARSAALCAGAGRGHRWVGRCAHRVPSGSSLGFRRGEGLVAKAAQGVVRAADHLASHREGGSSAADPVGDPPVVGVVGRAGPGGALRGLEQRPAQQRRALPGQVSGGALPSEECTVMSRLRGPSSRHLSRNQRQLAP